MYKYTRGLYICDMVNQKRRPLRAAIEKLGGCSATARVLGGSWNMVWKWLNISHMPHTEFSGATRYARGIEEALGGEITAEEILDYERRIITGEVNDPEQKAGAA